MTVNLERCQANINIQMKESKGKFSFSGTASCDFCQVKVKASAEGGSVTGFNYAQAQDYSRVRTDLESQKRPLCAFFALKEQQTKELIEKSRQNFDYLDIGSLDHAI